MPLPKNIPQIETFLQSLQTSCPENSQGWEEWVAIPEEEKLRKDDGREFFSPLKIWFSEKAGVSIDAILRKISEQLRYQDHPTNLAIANTILAFFTYAERSSRPAIDQFNEVFSKIIPADLNQYFLFRLPSPPTFRFDVGPFSIGPFDHTRLAYQCRKAKSDFFDRYCAELKKMPLAIERKPFSVKVIAWHKLIGKSLPWMKTPELRDDILKRLYTAYYAQLSAILFEDFFHKLNLEQELGIALGSGWFDSQKLAELIGTHRVSVFLKIGNENAGFVSPVSSAFLRIDLGGAHRGIPATTKILKEQFGLRELNNNELHEMIRNFTHFLSLAAKHHNAGRHAEGFLHAVIALDLLLGERLESSRNVAKRSAVLCHQPLGKSFKNALQDCEKIYDVRSRYVHAGQSPDEKIWALTQRISREIAFCLLRIQRDEKNCTPGFRQIWVRDLDFLSAMLESGRSPSLEEFARVGVAKKGDFTLGDFENFLGNFQILE